MVSLQSHLITYLDNQSDIAVVRQYLFAIAAKVGQLFPDMKQSYQVWTSSDSSAVQLLTLVAVLPACWACNTVAHCNRHSLLADTVSTCRDCAWCDLVVSLPVSRTCCSVKSSPCTGFINTLLAC